MIKQKLLLMFLGLSLASLSCSRETSLSLVVPSSQEGKAESRLNEFVSRKDFQKAIGLSRSELRSLAIYTDNGDNEEFIDLIPNDNFRRLVSKKGQFVVSDTLYQITPYGTIFSPLKDSVELNKIVREQLFSQMNPVRDSLYKLGSVYLYKTFGEYGYDMKKDSITDSQNNELRSVGISPEISSFPIKNMNRVTVVGKLIEGFVGTKKDGIEYLQSNRRRRLSASFYSYNYFVHAERGIEAQVEKRMWHGGWGRLVNWGGTTIGYNGIIFREKTDLFSGGYHIPNLNFLNSYSIHEKDGGFLQIVNPNFLLNSEEKFANYYILSNNEDETQESIERLAKELSSNKNDYSFKHLENVYKTKCVGFIVDCPKSGYRYTYITGTSRWKPGPRQVYIFGRNSMTVEWGDFIIGGTQLAIALSSIPSGTFWVYVKNAIKSKNVQEGAKKFFQSFKKAEPSVYVAGSVYAYTEDGSGYCGMTMYKQNFGK